MTDQIPDPFDHELTLQFNYADPDRARTITNALAPEIGAVDDPRSTADLTREGSSVVVRVRARDLVALRAGFNSWIRLVDVAERVAERA